MNDFEQKKVKIKTIVSHIICGNPIIYEVIENSASRRQQKFVVTINEDKNSRGSRNDGKIILGVGNLEELYKVCNNFIHFFNLNFGTGKGSLNVIAADKLSIE